MEPNIQILVVDDEPDIRRIIRILLENKGYAVLEAPNGREAVESVRACPSVDLILMDIMMPDMTPDYQKDAGGNYVLDDKGNKIENSKGGYGNQDTNIELYAM